MTIKIVPKSVPNTVDSSFILLRDIEEDEINFDFSYINPDVSFLKFD